MDDIYLEYKHSSEYLNYLFNLGISFFIEILENSYNEVYVTDREGKIIYVNPKSLANYGLEPEELIGKYNSEVWRGKWNQPTAIQSCVESKRTIFAEQTYLLTGKSVVTIATPIFDIDGEVKYVSCIVQEPINQFDISYKNIRSEKSENEAYDEKLEKKDRRRDQVISHDYNFCKKLVEIRRVAKSDIPILILGESGTGKSLIAEYIHENSDRKDNPLIIINCSAIPENLLESELFGYAPHAFTGASPKGKVGLIELAHTGTLFLDEIGDLAPSLQAKLLDVLENKRFIPVGGKEMKYVDIRIITATNRNLEKLVEEGKFREDLFWRISVATTKIPPLRERKDDILPLASYFLEKYNKKYGKIKDFSAAVAGALLEYDWPGNVRQLKNIVELLYIKSSGNIITANRLPDYIYNRSKKTDESSDSYDYIINSIERSLIRHYYKKYPSSRKLAIALKLSQSKANRLINKHCKDLLKTI